MNAEGPEGPSGVNLASAPLFSQVQYYVVEGHGLKAEQLQKICKILDENGAVEHDKLSLNEVTHVISNSIDFEEYEAVSSKLIPVVKPDWVEVSLSKRKLANPRQHSPDPRLFFSGVVVCCSDLPSGDKDAIIGGVLAMGGLHSSAVSKLVTHIVTLTTDTDKCHVALTRNLKCKLVLPHWFDDCLRLGKRIDEGPYLLPDPEILRRPGDRIPDASRPDLIGASSPQPGRLPTPAGTPSQDRRRLSVFKDKRVMLSTDLEIGSHLRGTIEDLIISSGGTVTGSVHKANIFICQYRENQDYRIASRAGKDVGNLPWLYHLITHNAWTSPLRRLLHYPIARYGLPGFKNFRISLSNYNGEARVYLENLAKAAGGEFTKTMKQDNTHLITAHTASEKCDAAKEWNINMVNHLWLEESYAKWQIQTLSDPRYTHFPPRTNLGEVVGQTPIDKQAIERFFFPKGADADDDVQEDSLPKPTHSKDRNVLQSKLVDTHTEQLSSPINGQGVMPHRPVQLEMPVKRALKRDTLHSDNVDFRTPAKSRFVKEGKENETPSTTSSRGAKDRAVAKLHELAPDIALYEKEKKRVGGVVFGGRRSDDDMRTTTNRKRSVSQEDDESAESEADIRGVKRAKKSKPPASMRLLLTGYQKWAGNPKVEQEERGRLRELGILLTQDPTSCTHVASPRIVRTQKFICALAHAPMVLSTNFVDECLAKNQRLSTDAFKLKDPEGEKKIGSKLSLAIQRAKANNGRLLRGYSIYCTEGIYGGYDTYRAIVEANGGKCLLYRARAGSIVTSRPGASDGTTEDAERGDPEFVYLISGATPDESRLWSKFSHMAQDIDKAPRIAKTDWMLNLALSQEIKWLEEYELTDKDIKTEQ